MGDWTYMTNNMCFFCVSEKKRVEFLFELLSSIVDVGAPLKFRSARFFSGRLSGTFWYPPNSHFWVSHYPLHSMAILWVYI